jgi:protein arginine kinase activator
MKCDSCQEKATVFYTQVADGKLKKFVLCETCAQAKGITNTEGLLMAEELLGTAAPVAVPPDLSPFESKEMCLSCSFTLEDFRKVGRLGCPDCYRAFAGEIYRRLPSMHKGQSHTGYMPEGLVKQQAVRHELSDLEARLETAVKDEDYEEAAQLRDRISGLAVETKEGAITS